MQRKSNTDLPVVEERGLSHKGLLVLQAMRPGGRHTHTASQLTKLVDNLVGMH